MLLLLSSDLCRHLIKSRDTEILTQLESWSAQSDEIMLSAITYAELVAGALQTANKEKHMALVQAFCERLDDIVPWDSNAVNCYTDIQVQAMRDGRALNMNDAMLAAHAISLQAEMCCLSDRTFAGISGLKIKRLKQE